tara:strand:- start:868 stop:1611 length:744 start_codon:yes stop_codon:yes gene_type:complete
MKYLDTKAESLENKITQIFGETVAKEGNKFTKALNAARENGKNYFEVDGKQFKTEDYAKEGFGANTPTSNQGVATIRRAQAAPKGGNRTNPGQMKPKTEAMDKVNPTAVKKKFDDRKDKDIDNDGDVDSSDKFLHKRRKAISKAVKKEWIEADGSARRVSEGDKRKKMEKVSEDKKSIVDIQQEKNQSMREMLAKIWGVEEGKSPFMPQESKKPMKSAKTESGEKATKVEVNPELQQPGSTVTTPDR